MWKKLFLSMLLVGSTLSACENCVIPPWLVIQEGGDEVTEPDTTEEAAG